MSIKAGNGSIGSNYVSQTYVSGSPKLSVQLYETFTDTLTVIDSKLLKPIKTFTESISFTDSFARLGNFIRSLTDAIGITDTKISTISTTKTDTVSITDSHTRILALTRSFTDAIGLGDVISKFLSKVAFVESVIISDVHSILKLFLIVLSDIVTLGEDFSTGLQRFFSRLFVDGISFADSWDRLLNKLIYLTDSLLLVDLTVRTLPVKIFTDTIGLIDTISKSASKVFTDTLSTIDSLLKKTIRNFVEAINITDTINTAKIKIRLFIDSILMTDDLSIAQALVRMFIDTMTFSDSILKSISRTLSDAIAFMDNGMVTMAMNFIDSLNLSESITKSVKIIVSDTIRFVDDIVKRLNGMVIEWTKIVKKTVEWTKANRLISSMTKIAKKQDSWTNTSKTTTATTKIARNESIWTKLRRINDHE